MRIAFTVFNLFVAGVCGCADYQRAASLVPAVSERDPNWPSDWAVVLGQSVTLEGTPENWKLGAFLTSVGNGGVWIEDFSRWPKECFADGKGKRLKVTGIVTERKDVPEYAIRPVDLNEGRAPTQATREVKEWRKRYLLKNVKWQVVN